MECIMYITFTIMWQAHFAFALGAELNKFHIIIIKPLYKPIKPCWQDAEVIVLHHAFPISSSIGEGIGTRYIIQSHTTGCNIFQGPVKLKWVLEFTA